MSDHSDDVLRTTSPSTDRRTALKAIGAIGAAGAVGTSTAAADAGTADGPTAIIEADPLPVESGEELTLDASASQGSIREYEWYRRNWEWSDGYGSSPSATGPTLSDQYTDGPWGFKLVVTDDEGRTDETEINVVVLSDGGASPTAKITASPESAERDTFSGRTSTSPNGSVESYEWYFYNTRFSDSYRDSPSRTGPDWTEKLSDDTWRIKLEITDSTGRTDATEIEYTPE